MKNPRILKLAYGLASSLLLVNSVTYGADPSPLKNLPLVFDPLTKKYFIGGNTQFVLKQNDEGGLVDRIDVSIDGGDYHTYNNSIQFKEEGKHTLKFRAINPVNTWSPVQFLEVFADLTPPTTEGKFSESHYFKDNSGVYVGLNSTISLASQDNLSGVASIEYSWDGKDFLPYTQPIKVESQGKQTLFFHATDRVGNSEPVKKLEFVSDGTPPNTQLNLTGIAKPAILNGRTYISDSAAYALDSTDDLSKVAQTWVSIDGKPATLYIKPLYFLQEGPHTLAYYSVDNVGNKEKTKNLAIYTVSTPPKTHAIALGKLVNTGGLNYATTEFQLKLEAQENVVGVERIEAKTEDNGAFKPYLEPIPFKTPGLHTITYRSVDRAGNFEPTKTFMVHIDNKAPDTTLSTAQPTVVRSGVTYSPSPNILTFNVGSSSVGVQETLVSINSGPFEAYQGPITLTADKKTYDIAYKSVDKLGNEEIPKKISYHMIGSIPIVDLFISNGQSSEEQVRTNYLDQTGKKPATPAPAAPAARSLSSEKEIK